MNHTAFRIALWSTLAVMVVALIAWQWGLPPFAPRQPGGVVRIGGPFTLVDHTGQQRTEKDYRGKLMLIYFGYTFCPDACPTALQAMTVALDGLGKSASEVQPLLITIDPARDTSAHLKSYVPNFPGLVGLTGSAEQIRAAAKAYHVYYRNAGEATDYLMDHSSIVFLMDRDGRYLTRFSHNSLPETMAAEIRKHL
ncbi:MAG: SCO family protein [Alphaproteobacteria bacterium]